MKAYVYIGVTDESVLSDGRVDGLWAELRQGGAQVHGMPPGDTSIEGADILISVGGDGTFLAASSIAALSGVPVVGVNLGRLGFLSENRTEHVAKALLSGDYVIEDATVLRAVPKDETLFENAGMWPFAFNEFTVHRTGSAILGVDVCVNGTPLPTYWADGLILATSA